MPELSERRRVGKLLRSTDVVARVRRPDAGASSGRDPREAATCRDVLVLVEAGRRRRHRTELDLAAPGHPASVRLLRRPRAHPQPGVDRRADGHREQPRPGSNSFQSRWSARRRAGDIRATTDSTCFREKNPHDQHQQAHGRRPGLLPARPGHRTSREDPRGHPPGRRVRQHPAAAIRVRGSTSCSRRECRWCGRRSTWAATPTSRRAPRTTPTSDAGRQRASSAFKSAGSIGAPNRNPCARSHPMPTADRRCAAVSMPSATSRRPRSRAREMLAAIGPRIVVGGMLDQRTVELELRHGQSFQLALRRVTGSEVIQGDAEPE